MNVMNELTEVMEMYGFQVKIKQKRKNEELLKLIKNKMTIMEFKIETLNFLAEIRIHCNQNIEFLNEDMLFSIISFVEKEEKYQNRPVIIRFFGNCRDEKIRIKEILKEYGYVHTTSNIEVAEKIEAYQKDKYVRNQMVHEKDWKEIEDQLDFLETFNQIIEEVDQKELLFRCKRYENLEYYLFMEGYRAELVLEKQNEGYNVQVFKAGTKEKIYAKKLCNKQDMMDFFNHLLPMLKKERKIKNLFDPPIQFYGQWASRNVRDSKVIYDAFLQVFTPKEIEEFASFCIKNDVKKHQIDERQFMYVYGEKAVVVMEKEEKVLVVRGKENWKKEILAQILKIKQETVEKNIEDIF